VTSTAYEQRLGYLGRGADPATGGPLSEASPAYGVADKAASERAEWPLASQSAAVRPAAGGTVFVPKRRQLSAAVLFTPKKIAVVSCGSIGFFKILLLRQNLFFGPTPAEAVNQPLVLDYLTFLISRAGPLGKWRVNRYLEGHGQSSCCWISLIRS
jgi:hypothetical protein